MNHEYSDDTVLFYHIFSFVFIVRNIREFFFLLRQWPWHGQRSPRYVINDGCLIWSYICKRALDLQATEHGFPPKSEQTICDEQTTYKWLIRRWELFLHVLCLLIYHSKHIRFFKIDDIHIKRNESFFFAMNAGAYVTLFILMHQWNLFVVLAVYKSVQIIFSLH